jgi:hypothetical protein
MSKLKRDEFSNMGDIWTNAEIEKLLYEIKNNLSISQIAKSLRRTEGSIICRLRHQAYEMYINNIDISTIQSTLRLLSYEQIVKTIERRKSLEKRDDFKIILEFKLFMKEKIVFDDDLHNIFDEFISFKLKQN